MECAEDIGLLFLGGAKRVSMARKFKAAAAVRGMTCRIYSYEMCTEVPIALEAEVLVGLRWKDPEVVDDIVRICRQKNIHAVIPFVDGAVAIAAAVREHGIFAPVLNAEGAELMFDKVRANSRFMQSGLPVPRTWECGSIVFPLIAKPRHGSASKGLIMIDTQTELEALKDKDAYLIQERMDHRREITVDCYTDIRDGRVLALVPRSRDEITGGEVSRTTVFHDERVTQLVERVLGALKDEIRGAITVQLIENKIDGRISIMEINPRLGGGAVAAVAAGADLPGLILDQTQGRELKPCAEYKDVVVARYQDEAVFPVHKKSEEQ